MVFPAPLKVAGWCRLCFFTSVPYDYIPKRRLATFSATVGSEQPTFHGIQWMDHRELFARWIPGVFFKACSRWWFRICFFFASRTWEDDPIWRSYFFKWVESTNQCLFCLNDTVMTVMTLMTDDSFACNIPAATRRVCVMFMLWQTVTVILKTCFNFAGMSVAHSS